MGWCLINHRDFAFTSYQGRGMQVLNIFVIKFYFANVGLNVVWGFHGGEDASPGLLGFDTL
jgi:hypothetical protein